MANRRMIGRVVYRKGKFLRLSFAAQALYTHLIIDADDDGAVEAFPIGRMIGANEEALKELEAAGFVTIMNDDWLVFINDWASQNKVQADRYTPSNYGQELEAMGFRRIERGYLPPETEV